jgi:hypothetical protein
VNKLGKAPPAASSSTRSTTSRRCGQHAPAHPP